MNLETIKEGLKYYKRSSGEGTEFRDVCIMAENLVKEIEAKQLALCGVINWVLFDEGNEPEDVVEYYFTCDDNANIEVNQWFEGDCFETCSGGHWRDTEGCEIKNITHWAELTKAPCL